MAYLLFNSTLTNIQIWADVIKRLTKFGKVVLNVIGNKQFGVIACYPGTFINMLNLKGYIY